MKKYGVNRIVLMVRDTERLFAYWEIGEDKKEHITKEIGADAWSSSKFTLRLYDVTDIIFDGFNAHAYFDTEVNESASSWYVNCPLPNKNYVVDLILETKSKKLFVLSRSNTIKVPRAEVAEQDTTDTKDTNLDSIFKYSRGKDLPEILSSLKRFNHESKSDAEIPKCWDYKKMILCRYCTYRFNQSDKSSEASTMKCWEFKSKYPSEISSPLACLECEYYKEFSNR